jgi:serine/threonine protein kinase
MPPTTIANRYRVDRAVGRGGMGTVWLCTDEVLGRTVAVKQVGHLPGESTPDLARALREARSAAALSHPNVVSIFDAIEDGEDIWLVMEYVPGRTLSEIMKAEGPLAPERLVWIGAQVADGLAAAHLRGTTHRDVKPGNILVTDNDHAKISDFGIARTMGDAQLTQTGMVTGTPGYFSPQLARGREPSPADDVWALGATLFTAVEGSPPFPEQGNALAMLSTIATTPPLRPSRAGVLIEAITHMMEPDPASRWSMADVAHNLHRLHEQAAATGTHEHVAPLPEESSTATLIQPSPTPVNLEPTLATELEPTPVASGPPADGRRRRWPLVLLGLAAAVIAAVVLWRVLPGEDPDPTSAGAGDQPSGQASPGEPASPDADATEESSPEASTPEAPDESPAPDEEVPAADGDSAAQFVSDYYSLLPGDTAAAWPLLSPEMQSRVGSYEDYDGFWSTIDSVTVDEATSSGSDAVEVSLTYTTDGDSEQEVRRLQLEESDDGYLIVDDEVVG